MPSECCQLRVPVSGVRQARRKHPIPSHGTSNTINTTVTQAHGRRLRLCIPGYPGQGIIILVLTIVPGLTSLSLAVLTSVLKSETYPGCPGTRVQLEVEGLSLAMMSLASSLSHGMRIVICLWPRPYPA